MAGEAHGLRDYGSFAMNAMRMEKGFKGAGELTNEVTVREADVMRFAKLDKGEFVGRDAYLAIRDRPPREKLSIVRLDTDDADASGGEPVFLADGTPVGRVSSGAYGHGVQASIALCFIKAEHADAGTRVDVAILGRPHAGVILEQPPFDAGGRRGERGGGH